ncbi:uncharacterized protein VDAG_05165 [Verticillium dahliae VdLs.17]|uniref:Uncharacterized protein n=1 Tax=Verticillium dahliae (strain VdLs.17 / ATCC MYA-4575 / FGSC 10137) TaxID=498257 RepID=G2X4T3_VERDV|nr:uncharacterized protein VDAG_05165 [Verticillium dahliae VdLs.17]EGY23727.1 hypothetical protein VDAG_05165 [Verticillium dahliae VdLs.17]
MTRFSKGHRGDVFYIFSRLPMLILKSQDAEIRDLLSWIPELAEKVVCADIHAILSNIKALAGQVVCYSADFKHADGRSNLMVLPGSLLPRESQNLVDLWYSNEQVAVILREWAEEKKVSHSTYKTVRANNHLAPCWWAIKSGRQDHHFHCFTKAKAWKPRNNWRKHAISYSARVAMRRDS